MAARIAIAGKIAITARLTTTLVGAPSGEAARLKIARTPGEKARIAIPAMLKIIAQVSALVRALENNTLTTIVPPKA
jgi:hypothetical protein